MKLKVFRVRHTLMRAGRNAGIFDSDLVFMEGVPYIVMAWLGEDPTIRIALDPQRLHPLTWEEVDYSYELPVVDPRRFD